MQTFGLGVEGGAGRGPADVPLISRTQMGRAVFSPRALHTEPCKNVHGVQDTCFRTRTHSYPCHQSPVGTRPNLKHVGGPRARDSRIKCMYARSHVAFNPCQDFRLVCPNRIRRMLVYLILSTTSTTTCISFLHLLPVNPAWPSHAFPLLTTHTHTQTPGKSSFVRTSLQAWPRPWKEITPSNHSPSRACGWHSTETGPTEHTRT